MNRNRNDLSKTEIVKVQQNKTKKWYDDYSKIEPDYNMSNLNEPTKIYPNPSVKSIKVIPSKLSMLNLEQRLRDVLETKHNIKVKADEESVTLQLTDVQNLEILMDIEESFNVAPNDILDEEFAKCKSFRDMMNCLNKYV